MFQWFQFLRCAHDMKLLAQTYREKNGVCDEVTEALLVCSKCGRTKIKVMCGHPSNLSEDLRNFGCSCGCI